MKLSIILAPYDSGRRHEGFGQGPDALIAGGLVETLTLDGHDVAVEEIGEIGKGLDDREIATGFAVCKAVAQKVGRQPRAGPVSGRAGGQLPDHMRRGGRRGADSIIWFDQHGDINTPETSTYGFLDGMALATALGLCWRPMANAIPGFRPVDPPRNACWSTRATSTPTKSCCSTACRSSAPRCDEAARRR